MTRNAFIPGYLLDYQGVRDTGFEPVTPTVSR
jgi:hypothetical protein